MRECRNFPLGLSTITHTHTPAQLLYRHTHARLLYTHMHTPPAHLATITQEYTVFLQPLRKGPETQSSKEPGWGQGGTFLSLSSLDFFFFLNWSTIVTLEFRGLSADDAELKSCQNPDFKKLKEDT